MNDHKFILLFFLAAFVLIAVLFFFIYRSSIRSEEKNEGIKNPLQKRFYFLTALTAILIILLSVTIPKSPYFKYANQTPAKVVFVDARQYNFFMSEQAIDPEKPSSADSIIVPAGQVVEFRVTSLDVNHGFAIYNSDAQLVTQTQAMPGYVNRLRWKFDTPGTYNILCLEYCGLAHPLMRASFIVK